jgi:hypothetical protein
MTRLYSSDQSGSGPKAADVQQGQRIASDSLVHPETFRLPSGRERDRHFELGRSYWNSKILPNSENDFTPEVKSYVLRKKGSRTGVRLIDYQSAKEFILRHAERGPGKEAAHQDAAGSSAKQDK